MKKLITIMLLVITVLAGAQTKTDTVCVVKITESLTASDLALLKANADRIDAIEQAMEQFRSDQRTAQILFLSGAALTGLAYLAKPASDYDKIMVLGGMVSGIGVCYYFISFDKLKLYKKKRYY